MTQEIRCAAITQATQPENAVSERNQGNRRVFPASGQRMMLEKLQTGFNATRGAITQGRSNKIMFDTKDPIGTERRMMRFTPAAMRGKHQAADRRVNVVVAMKELKAKSPRPHSKETQIRAL